MMAKIEENVDWSKYGNHFSIAWSGAGRSVISISRNISGQIKVDVISAHTYVETVRIDYVDTGRLIGYVHDGKVSVLGTAGELVSSPKQIKYGAYSPSSSYADELLLSVSEQTAGESGILSYYMGYGDKKSVPIKNVGEMLPPKGDTLISISIPQNGSYVEYNWSEGLSDAVSDSFTFVFDDDTKVALFKGNTSYSTTENAGYILADATNMPSEMRKAVDEIANTAKVAPVTQGDWIAMSSFNDVGTHAVEANPIVFFDLIMTKNLEYAKKYVEDGTIPPDAKVNPSDAVKDTDLNEDEEDGTKTSTFDENEPSAPVVNSVNLSNLHNYWITKDQMQSFYDAVWNTDLTDFVKGAFTGIYENLISNMISLKYMPTSSVNLGGTGDSSSVILGFKTYNELTVQTIGNTVAPIVDIGSYRFSRAYNTFADYAPYTDIRLYLPFVGVVPLDTNLFMGTGGDTPPVLNIKAQYDLQSGLITYFIMRNKTMISSVSGRMAVEVPISLQSGLDTFKTISSNFIGKATSFAGNAMAGNPIGMVADIAQGSVTAPPQTVFSSVGGDGAFYTHPKCMIMIRHPQYNRPNNYSHVVGFPAYVTKKVSDLRGFNTIKNPVIPLADGMTSVEHDIIVSSMQKGLYY